MFALLFAMLAVLHVKFAGTVAAPTPPAPPAPPAVIVPAPPARRSPTPPPAAPAPTPPPAAGPGTYVNPGEWLDTPDPQNVQPQLPEESNGRAYG